MEPTRVLKNDEEVDRISNLPEAIVHQILSFLDMKYVVQTSVLSRRWRADIGTGDGFAELDEEGAKWMFNFLRGLHNVEDLKLSGYFLEAVSGVRAVLESKPIQFGNLRCLKVGRCDFSSDCVNAITYLLTISPNIESLLLQLFERTVHCGWELKYPYLDEVKTNSPEIEAFYKDAGLLTHCTLHHLKSVEIRGIQGRLNEFMFLEFLLKNSPVLKNMVLYAASGKESTHTKSKHTRAWNLGIKPEHRERIRMEERGILAILEDVYINPAEDDRREWKQDPKKGFTASSCLNWLTNQSDQISGADDTNYPSNFVWNSKVPPRVSFFIW